MATWSLSGKVVLITGGAGGIGAATAGELARKGAVCVLADLNPEALKRTAAQLGGDPLTLALDVTDPAACERAVAAAVERHGGLDAVWANAGVASFGPVLRTDPAAWRRTIEVNVTGVFNTVRPALPHVIEREGYVAITASVASFAHAPGLSAYCATKAGVEAFSNSLRIELAQYGVDVASIHPTWIATPMVTDGQSEVAAFARLRESMSFPLHRTYPVERAAQDIARGFERRSRRICSPRFLRALHAVRPAATTRVMERDLLEVAPEIERAFTEQAEREGIERASVTEAVGTQVGGAP